MDRPKKSTRAGADRRWTLLFIGDHGNVVTLKHFKAIVIGAGILFFLAIVFAAVLLFQNIGVLKQNKVLQKRSADSEKQIEELRHEKEVLMARLVLAEAKTKENIAGDRPIREEMKIAEPEAAAPQEVPQAEPIKTEPKKPPVPQATLPESEPAETEEAEPVPSVAVADFKILRESNNQYLSAEFKIRNTNPDQQRVEGHAIVVLKGDDLLKDQWLVMPAVGLAGEKPSGKRGKRFSIQRFRTMNFTAKAPDHSDQFETAAVYVFTKSGELLLEEDFEVKLPPIPATSPAKPASEAVIGETPASQSPEDQAPANDKPSTDFSVDSLENPTSVF